MKSRHGTAPAKRANRRNFAATDGATRALRLTPWFMLSAATIAMPSGQALAACVQVGSTVTCSGTTTVAFGTGFESNLSLTVQPGASITVGAGFVGVDLRNNNTAINNGTITVGSGSIGMQGYANNNFTNAGTIALGGTGGAGISLNDSNNVVINTGSINGAGASNIGVDIFGTGNIVANSGAITMTGAGSTGILGNGTGHTIQNSGTIKVGDSAGIGGSGVFLDTNNTLNNTGTITAAGSSGAGVVMYGNGAAVTNTGIISASGAVGAAILIVGMNKTITNNGTMRGGVDGASLFSFSTSGTTITNNGTLDGRIYVLGGSGNSLTNDGLITITDPATALAPGNHSFGGSFTQTGQGTPALRVDNAGNHDGVSANQANLNGTLRLVMQAGFYQATTTYTNVLQTTSGVTGQFANVTASSAFFNAAATYNANTVDVTLTRQGFGAVAGETANQRAVGNALEAGYSPALTGTAAAFYSQLLQAGSVRVLDQLSGEGTSGTQNTAFGAGSLFGQTMDGQMDAWRASHRGEVTGSGALGYAAERPVTSAFNALKAPPLVQPQWHAWTAGFGAGQSLSGDPATGSAGFSDRIAGGAAGVDHLLNPDLLVGVAAGGSSATFNVDDRATSGRLDGAHVGAYAMQRFGTTYVSGQLAYSHFNNATTRTIAGIGADEIAKGSFGSDQLGGRLEIGRTYDFGAGAVTPFAALQAARLWQAGYTETSVTGGGPGVLGLSYAARNVSSLPLFLGSKFDARFDLGGGMMWMPFANLAWVHEFSPARNITATLLSMSVLAFTAEGARAAGDAGRVELGSRLVLNSWSELSARFTGEFSNVGQSYAGTGSLRINW